MSVANYTVTARYTDIRMILLNSTTHAVLTTCYILYGSRLQDPKQSFESFPIRSLVIPLGKQSQTGRFIPLRLRSVDSVLTTTIPAHKDSNTNTKLVRLTENCSAVGKTTIGPVLDS